MTTDVHDELAAERHHLLASRDCLRLMRERAAEIGDVGVDAFASEALGTLRRRRLAALADDGTTPLFFGRVDYAETKERFHVGRRHILDSRGDPMVVDWRAPIALPFYRATAAEPLGVDLRRRFGFAGGALTGFEDERLGSGEELGTESRILTAEIERPRVGPMRDIVATIQPDQDVLVRADLAETICVQGAPGTGKTAVGLHRAAYLLYTFRERLRRSGVLVVGPNRAFLAYIANVLPALGEVDVTQLTIDDVPGRVPIRGADPAEAATVKGDARMADVLRRAVYAGLRRPAEALVVPTGSRYWRLSRSQLDDLFDGLRATDVRYGVACTRLGLLVGDVVRRRMEEEGDAPGDRAAERIANSKTVRAFVDSVWQAVDPATLVWRLLGDEDFLADRATGLLDPAEQQAIRWEPVPRSARSVRWSVADAFLVDEAADLVERTPSFGHVVVDEAQDLSPMQCRALGRRCTTGSATLLGDIAQGTTPWATDSWEQTLTHLGKPGSPVERLHRGYRVPQQILDFANRLLPVVAPDLPVATSVRRSSGALRIEEASDLAAAVVAATRAEMAAEGSVGIICPDAHSRAMLRALARAGIPAALAGDEETQRVTVVPATLAKGLEFDAVIAVEPAEIVDAEPRGLRRLFVVLTRAVSRLTVVHARPLPAPLG